MQTKYSNVMLTIIAICLVVQIGISLGSSSKQKDGRTFPAKSTSGGEIQAVPVTIDEPLQVVIAGVEIDKSRRRLQRLNVENTLPISIDQIQGQSFGIKTLPVAIVR